MKRRLISILSPIGYSLRYTSAVPVRLLLATAAMCWATFMAAFPIAVAGDPTYELMFGIMPRCVWAFLFAIDGLLLAWRLLDEVPRVAISRVVNALTASLWSVYLVVVCIASHGLPPDAGDAVAILLAAIWATLRTELTLSDRQSA